YSVWRAAESGAAQSRSGGGASRLWLRNASGSQRHLIPSLLRLSRFCSGSFQISIIAKIAGPGRKRRNSDPDPSSGSDSGDGQPVSAKCLKMSSDGGNSALGGDAAAHRGGSQQRRGHGREAASDLSSCSSKKKQKDRANQESREAKRAVAVVDAVIAEVRKDVFVDWKQNVNEVTVRLRCGDGIQRKEDVSTSFTDKSCHVSFPDGRQWSCQLQEEIEASCSRVQYREKGGFLHLIMQKKIPFHTWPSLKSNKKKEPVSTENKSNKEMEKCVPVELIEEPKSSKNRRTGKAEEAASGGKGDHSGSRAANGPEEQPKEEELRLGPFQEQTPGPAWDGSSHTSTAEGEETQKQSSRGRGAANPQGDGLAAAGGTLQHGCSSNETAAASTEALGRGAASDPETTRDHRTGPSARDCPTSAAGRPRGGRPSTVALNLGYSSEEEKQDQPKDEPCLESRQQEGWECKLGSVRSLVWCDPDPDPDPGLTGAAGWTCSSPSALGPMVDLQYVKNDSYEKGTDLMVVNVYMKGLSRDTTRVLFREQHFTLFFQTSDGNFLRLHSDCGPNTHFKWQVKLRNLIEPEQCSYSFTPSRLDITLKKRHSQRWGGLEAPASQGAVGGAKVAVPSSPACMEKAQPDSSKHSLPAQQEPPRVQEEKAKVCKASARAEEGSLDPGAPSTVSEHVALTKAEPTFTMPKPTCMVQPMTHALPASKEPHEDEEEKKVCLPGFTGLVNLGNTCFMNSVIQSLSNTRELRDYFLDRAFEGEINCSNPLGTGGRLAIGFAVLLRALWKGTHHAFQPSKLKAIVASKASQFTGYAQHDAQEFMAFLLDGLHEDLNRIQNKPYTETVDSDGRLDEVVADEAWQRHKMRNDSFIVDLFQGQFKSKLVCPMCSKVSITFDPFLYLPVPLPQKQKVLSVYYFAKEPHKKPIKASLPCIASVLLRKRFSVSVSKENSHTAEVLESISRSVRVKAENLRLAEVGKNRFQRMFLPSHSLDTVSSSDMLFCFELLSKEMAKEKVVLLRVQQKLQVPNIPISKCAACLKPPTSEEDKLKRCTRCYRVGYCNQSVLAAASVSEDPLAQSQELVSTQHGERGPAFPGQRARVPALLQPPEPAAGGLLQVHTPQPAATQLCQRVCLQEAGPRHRFSVDVFQPPFHSGRTSPDSRCAGDLPVLPAGCPEPGRPSDQALCSSSAGSADPEPDGPSLQPGQQQCAQASAPPAGEATSPCSLQASATPTSDLGFFEQFSSVSCCSFDPHSEKETSCEKTVRPEAAVTGYQQPSEVSSAHASQFFISLLDSNNKEQRLDEKEDALANLPEDATLELVWKNNERLKEYVLVSSKDLDYEEDPSSLSETARAGHFTLEQCLNLFTKPEVLAPEEAWYCPKCQQHREASKQLLLWRLPNVLIIQLKRFSFRSFIWRDKINDMVDFPIRQLVPWPLLDGRFDFRNLDLSRFCIGMKDEMQQPVYDLYAVINHYGGMIGGHYTAYARLPSDKNSQRSDVGQCAPPAPAPSPPPPAVLLRGGPRSPAVPRFFPAGWRLFDDSTVTMVEESQVVTRYAYVLFYRRRNSPVERPAHFHRPGGAESPTAAGAAASQASLIWRQLEEEEEGPREGSPRLLWRRQAQQNREEEDADIAGVSLQHPPRRRRRRRISEHPADDCGHFFVLGTLAAVFALLVNVLYPFLST
ncbi:unnamed protein product, partial [Tetraodon nigroviridis]